MAPKKLFCGCCQKRLGKGSKQNPTVWCHVCGWFHFTCSELGNKIDFDVNFLCSKCSRSRVMIEGDDSFAVAYTKVYDAYTNAEKTTAFGNQIKLARATNCLFKHVNRYLKSSETYTNFKLTRKRFPRLKVISYRLNEVWSIDLADMQQISREKLGVWYLFVAVETLSCFLWVLYGSWPWCLRHLKHVQKRWEKLFQLLSNEMLQKFVQSKIFPERYGLIKVKSLLVNSETFAKRIV